MHWRRKWQPTPVFLPGESQGQGSLVGCRLWGHAELDTTEATQQQQQTVVEVMKTLVTSFERSRACTVHLVPPAYSRPPPTHTSAEDAWTLTGKSGSVSCGVIAPFSWVLVPQGSICALQESVSPVLCKFWWLYGGLMATSSKRAYAIPRSAAPRASTPTAVHC